MSILQTLRDAILPAAIPSPALPRGLKVMIIGPHPDDFDSIGVTLRHLQQNGAELRVGVVRGGSGIEDSYCSPPTLEVKSKIRENEQRNSCRFFGLPEESLTFFDMELDETAQPFDTRHNRDILTRFILPLRPDIVCIPHHNDSNTAHRAIHAMVTDILASADFASTAFLNRDPKTIAMRADLYMPFGDTMAEWKAELLRFHDSQHQRNLNTRGYGFDERIMMGNRQIADDLAIDAPYAEVFELTFHGLP